MEIPVVIQLENDLITAHPQPTSRHTNRYAGFLVAVCKLQIHLQVGEVPPVHSTVAPLLGCDSISASQPHSQPCFATQVAVVRTAHQECVQKTCLLPAHDSQASSSVPCRPARPSSSRGTGPSSLSFEQWKKEEVPSQQSQLQRPSSDSPSELDDLVRWLHTGGTPLETGAAGGEGLGVLHHQLAVCASFPAMQPQMSSPTWGWMQVVCLYRHLHAAW